MNVLSVLSAALFLATQSVLDRVLDDLNNEQELGKELAHELERYRLQVVQRDERIADLEKIVEDQGVRIDVLPLHAELVAKIRPTLLVLMGAVSLSFPLTHGLDAVWGYEPSVENMPATSTASSMSRTWIRAPRTRRAVAMISRRSMVGSSLSMLALTCSM